ncbi:hypothetical protein [Methylobacterium sp. WSM2598]|uniref:hypothetical protein n=1 Tax=Methylobacterium sp. WSM2598 TaxID=398261 RepID=UPI000368E3EB|nr:hypothetical protein [Methylobacterium sp. WSM2598]
MLYACVAALGCMAGLSLRWVGLGLLASVLTAAVGVAGAVHGQTVTATLLETVATVTVLELAYVVPVLLDAVRG